MVSPRAVLNTLRVLGLRVALMEALRRVTGKSYEINGIMVGDSATFRLIKMITKRGWSVAKDGDWHLLRTEFGVVASRDFHLFREVVEQPDYGPVWGRVLDVGAYLGETAVKFAKTAPNTSSPMSPCTARRVQRR